MKSTLKKAFHRLSIRKNDNNKKHSSAGELTASSEPSESEHPSIHILDQLSTPFEQIVEEDDDDDEERSLGDFVQYSTRSIETTGSSGQYIQQKSSESFGTNRRKTTPGLGNRTTSTALRLRSQGFESNSDLGESFAVQCIDRESEYWNNLIRPFVSDLAFQSLTCKRSQSDVCFSPFTCEAAILFVDLSGYSRIAAAVAHKGAHALSSAVNAYLERLLRIIHRHGGDVVKFAGDAVLVVWEGAPNDESCLEYNLLCAACCALELQNRAFSHKVQDDLIFQIHCAITYGIIESEIFQASTIQHMQRLFHSVSGEALVEIAELVDLAQAGQICLSDKCLPYLKQATTTEIPDIVGACLLKSMDVPRFIQGAMTSHVECLREERMERRKPGIEEDFIHPNVLLLLSHGGLSPTQIAQMRNLCVLFIAMTSSGNSVNWLHEVQVILDQNRCPIVQIIDDDKGVHVVAAVNLYESVPESSLLGLKACTELVEKQVGCAIGVAMGSTFCGVTGSNRMGCRWDITGPPPVRAARLMQYALQMDMDVAIDGSLFNDPVAATRMDLFDPSVSLKGSPEPCAVYTLSNTKLYSVFRVLETVNGTFTNGYIDEVRRLIKHGPNRRLIMVTGIPLSGKSIICQQAAALEGFVPYLHVCDPTTGLAQLAGTLATWFSFSLNKSVSKQANLVLGHIENGRWSRAHDECVKLIHLAIEKNLHACFVIDRIQFLDSFSISILRECLHKESNGEGRQRSVTIYRKSSRFSSASDLDAASEHTLSSSPRGRIIFLATHMSLYHGKSAPDIINDIKRSSNKVEIPCVSVHEASTKELRSAAKELLDLDVEDRWLRTFSEASGNALGYFLARSSNLRTDSLPTRFSLNGDDTTFDALAKTGEHFIPSGYIRNCKQRTVNQVSAEVAMYYSQMFDELPPLFQILTKVLAIATRRGYFTIPKVTLWEVLNDLISEGVESIRFATLIAEMTELHLIKESRQGINELLSFQSPALADVAIDVSTPQQISTVAKALLYRLKTCLNKHFSYPLIVASLSQEIGSYGEMRMYWKQGYHALLRQKGALSESDFNWWVEYIDDEVKAAAEDPEDIFGQSFRYPKYNPPLADFHLSFCRTYTGPISLGPIGLTVSGITRSLFEEYCLLNKSESRTRDIMLQKHRQATKKACEQYIHEVLQLEQFLSDFDLGASTGFLDEERDIVKNHLAIECESPWHAEEKAQLILQGFLPKFVEARVERLHKLAVTLRKDDLPFSLMDSPDSIISQAYLKCRASHEKEGWKQACEKALMVMASGNWKPRMSVEGLPSTHYQTICRIRDHVLKQVGDNHDSFVSLESFLIVTALMASMEEESLSSRQDFDQSSMFLIESNEEYMNSRADLNESSTFLLE